MFNFKTSFKRPYVRCPNCGCPYYISKEEGPGVILVCHNCGTHFIY